MTLAASLGCDVCCMHRNQPAAEDTAERGYRSESGTEIPPVQLMTMDGGRVNLLSPEAGGRSLVLVFYPGRRDFTGSERERMLMWAGCSIEMLRLGYRVVAVSSRPMHWPQPPFIQGLDAVREDIGFYITRDPALLLADSLQLPTKRLKSGRVFDHLTMAIRDGRRERMWHPVDAKQDARMVTEWFVRTR